jgi:hypothetical protein
VSKSKKMYFLALGAASMYYLIKAVTSTPARRSPMSALSTATASKVTESGALEDLISERSLLTGNKQELQCDCEWRRIRGCYDKDGNMDPRCKGLGFCHELDNPASKCGAPSGLICVKKKSSSEPHHMCSTRLCSKEKLLNACDYGKGRELDTRLVADE